MTKWQPVAGFEGIYEVSSTGNVRRVLGGQGARVGHILKPRRDRKGYLRVVLHDHGRRWEPQVHRLVALTFMPAPDASSLQVNHIDGNPANNDISNLEWVTNAENMWHSVHVLKRRNWSGERNGRAKLTEDAVREIRRLRGARSAVDIARDFGVSKQLVSAVWCRHYWKHVA